MDSKNEPADNPRLALVEVQPLVFFVKMWKYSSQAVCISFFTVEFLLRLAGSPDKIVFLKYPILFEGYRKRNYTFIGPVGHSIWWENSRNGSFGPKNAEIANF